MVKRVKIIVRTPHKDESSAAHIDRLISSVLFLFFSLSSFFITVSTCPRNSITKRETTREFQRKSEGHGTNGGNERILMRGRAIKIDKTFKQLHPFSVVISIFFMVLCSFG
jgi:hypothetical protein